MRFYARNMILSPKKNLPKMKLLRYAVSTLVASTRHEKHNFTISHTTSAVVVVVVLSYTCATVTKVDQKQTRAETHLNYASVMDNCLVSTIPWDCTCLSRLLVYFFRTIVVVSRVFNAIVDFPLGKMTLATPDCPVVGRSEFGNAGGYCLKWITIVVCRIRVVKRSLVFGVFVQSSDVGQPLDAYYFLGLF